jgi:UDP-N-acetylmuramate: L-alanyl-gamma-D-glutamyl-meso-diaminopimelate ligase
VVNRGLHIHLIAIGGTGMAPLACLLQERGHRVTGSDGPLYPPMSTLLAAAGIQPVVGFSPANLAPRPDLIVIGNAVPRSNPEAVEAERLAAEEGIARLSMPEALARFFLADRRPLVAAGTHGKTTTSALAAWVYDRTGRDPGFLVGGVPLDLGVSFRHGGGPRFIVEGDEYNAAYFDRGAKFLHYRPESLILTSVEYDHADLYPSHEVLLDAYARLIDLLPPGGYLAANGDARDVRRLSAAARSRMTFFGLDPENDVHVAGAISQDASGTHFSLRDPDLGHVEARLALWGEHNVSNALGVWSVARRDGLDPAAILDAFASFRGVRRRLELVGEPRGVAVIDDFAHHPTAVATTLRGLRWRFAGRRIVALFEPRSLTAGRAMFFEPYVDAFAEADVVRFAPIFHAGRLADDERLDLDELARRLGERGIDARPTSSLDELLAETIATVRPGDVVITMSSGSFGEMPRRLVQGLSATD